MIDWADLEARNAPLNAFVDFDRMAHGGEGELTGLTIGVKANIAVNGLPWTAGLGFRRDMIAKQDAEVVARMRAAGAAIVGTLNMEEGALGAATDNPWYGRTINPHRAGFTAGGSSGGSAAAVAAGLCDAALGTDTLGSVRIPAAYCGVYGLKPTHGAVSDTGLLAVDRTLDCIGPLARDLDTLEQVWAAMADVTMASANAPPQIYVLKGLGEVDLESGVLACYARACASITGSLRTLVLNNALHDIRLAGFVQAGRALIAELGAARTKHNDLISPSLQGLLDYCKRTPPRPRILADTKAALIAALGENGVLILPTAPQAAFPHGTRPPANQADFTCLASIAGLPTLALPSGHDASGLPVGVQLVGPPHSEAMLFALARQIDTKRGAYTPRPLGKD